MIKADYQLNVILAVERQPQVSILTQKSFTHQMLFFLLFEEELGDL